MNINKAKKQLLYNNKILAIYNYFQIYTDINSK